MKKLNVMQVNKLYYPVTGGVEKVVQEIAEGLNHQVNMKVLVCQAKGKSEKGFINNVKVKRSGSLGTFFSMPLSISFIKDFRKLSKNMDIVHFHLPFPLGDLALFLSGYKGKVVASWHSDIVRQKKLMKLYYPLMTWFLKRADKIIVATEGHINGSKYLGKYREKCEIIPYGLDPLIEEDSKKYFTQQKPNEDKNERAEFKFLFVGRLVYYKGCEVLIDAFSNLKGHKKLTIVGAGPLENVLKVRSEKLGILDLIEFKGEISQEELLKEYRSTNVFVLPSVARSEAFGLVQIEAMAYGKPVINTKLPGGVPYVSLHGKTGITVKPNDKVQLTKAMQWCMDHPDKVKKWGENAVVRVRTEYTLRDMLNKIRGLYQRLSDRG